MPTVADYRVLRDSSFSLQVDQERSLSFTLPDGFVQGTNLAKPIITFIADPTNNANNLRLEVDVNDQPIFSINLNGTVQRTVNEAISGQILNQNANNTVQFRVETGSGRVNLRSVILWYQVDV